MSADLPQILCIDDDVQVLQGLKLSLRQLGEVHLAEGSSTGNARGFTAAGSDHLRHAHARYDW